MNWAYVLYGVMFLLFCFLAYLAGKAGMLSQEEGGDDKNRSEPKLHNGDGQGRKDREIPKKSA